ncbi:flocculation protein FLO11 [Nicotiana sylvestris]|uniref:Flocculation protein FLO11 n=1 Tax=Nicotiana sylvestris TaxID=4096 RepID=A0A1U7X3N8_NICSY|nr:PREDICTED: flocculation protein FLO11 [Nicotiana sylvestris]
MERRSTFRFRLPWSQPAPAPSPAPIPASKPSTQPTTKTSRAPTTHTGSRAASQPSSSSTPTATSSSSPTETSTPNQPPSATSTATSGKPSSPAQPSAGTQGRNEVPTSTTAPKPISPTPFPQPSAEMNAPSQPSTSTSTLTETTPIPPQPSAESKAPIQPSTTNTSPLPESTTVPPQPSAERKAPVQSSTTNSTPANAPASPKSETQTPTTAITTMPTSTIAQSGLSSPPGVSPSPSSQTRASRIESQPLIPSLEQQGISSQPASPSDGPTKSRVSPPPSPSPSRSAPQSREMNPISSPTRKDPQVLSTDQLTSKVPPPASQSTSSDLPSGMTSQMQEKDKTIALPTFPLKQLDSSEPSSKSTEALTSISGKEPKFTAIRPQSEQMELLKKETISDTVAEAKVKSPEKVMKSSEISEVKSTKGITQEPSQISDSSGIIDEPKMVRQSETNIQETREVNEVVQEMRNKNYGTGEKIGGLLTSTKQPGTAFQSKKAYTEKQSNSDNDQIRVNLVSNGNHTKTVSSQPKNKTIVNSSSKETAGFAEQDIPLNKEVKDNISKFIHRMAVGDGKQNLEEGPVSVITLAGDNRGASMQLGSDSSSKEGAIHIHRGYKLNPDESADATTDAEGYSEGRRPKDARTMEDQEIEAYLNCNVQGLNNSITFDSAIAAKNPGIHMLFPHMPSEPIRSSGRTGPFEAHKAEFNVTPAQKLTYEPKIRRRCLTGLFLEPSDSDPDNPEKSPRHGCHVGCMEKSNDNEIDIL